jgi:hypothetical protein
VHVPDPRDQEVAYRYFKPFVERFKGCTAVLDVASGQGHFLDLMKEAGIPARGVELDVELSESCRDRGLDVEQGDFWRDPTHVRPYPASAIRKLLDRAGGWEILEDAEYTDRKPSLSRSLVYGLRNLFLGRYWGGDDLYVIARRVSD